MLVDIEAGHIHEESWPEADAALVVQDTVTMVVQINGKVRERIDVPPEIDEQSAYQIAVTSEKIKELLDGKEPKRVILRPPRLVNLVI